MINEERLKHMTKMAIFEKELGPEYQSMLRYSKREYVALHGWGGFIAGTLAFLIIYTIAVLYYFGDVIANLDMTYIMLIVAVGFLLYAAYIIMHVYNTRRKARKRYKIGNRLIKELRLQYEQLGEMYAAEEEAETPRVVRDTAMMPNLYDEDEE